MGYRSQVAIAIKKEEFQKHNTVKLSEALKDCDLVEQGNDHFTFIWEDVKWYPNYADVALIEAVLDEIDDPNYGFVRIGEDDNDIEKKGEYWEYGLNVSVSLSSEEGESVSKEYFFAPNSIKFIKED